MIKPAALKDDLKKYLIPLFERKTKSVSAIEVKEFTSYTDTLIIVEAASQRQTNSIAEHLIKNLKNLKIKPLGMEGVKEGQWALLDYGEVIIHIFESEKKAFFDLEGLWADAPRIDLSEFQSEKKKAEKDNDF